MSSENRLKSLGEIGKEIGFLGDEISFELYEQIHFLQYHYPGPIVFPHIVISYWGIFDEL